MLSVHGGIAFKNNERTNSLPIQNITSPDYIFLNIPDGFVLNVTVGEQVDIGQAVAFSADETASPVYSGISGNVCCISENTVTIKNNFKNHIHPGLSPIEIPLKEISDKELEALIKLMGIYDDQTPLYKKIKEAFGKIENIIISCTDTEPPAGASHAIVKEYPKELLGGIKILIHATKARRGIITLSVTNTKTDELLKEMISDPKLITTRIIENKYPLENDKYLIYALTRKEYQQNDLIKDSKCLVLKPESVVALYKCFTTGIPFVNKIISVSGKISEQKNLSVPIGTKISNIIEFCGGMTKENAQIIKGGIMSGEITDDNSTITPSIHSINIIDTQEYNPYFCIRCGKCIEVCPMLLKPLYLYANAVSEKYEKNIHLGVIHCIECGCCSYVCPSKLPLIDLIKQGKQKVLGLSESL